MKAEIVVLTAGLVGVVLTLTALFLLASPPPGVSLAWDMADTAGFAAFILLLGLFVMNGRPTAWPNCDGKFFMVLHRGLGAGALAMLGLHVLPPLWIAPLLVDDVLPSGPWPMLAGVAAACLMLAAALSGLHGVRRIVWRTARRFRIGHSVIATGTLPLSAFHVAGAGLHVNTGWKIALCVALTVGAAAWTPSRWLLRPDRNHAIPGRRRWRNMSIHARAIVALMLATSVLSAWLYALATPHGGPG
ncbi:ferric reductase-like transmembrane domain-containing protein [Gluconacetobacter tumulisoli]|uniref:Ferric reductase like transmembrane component n=1 Tax=Gluconacetobacter tumulisoli TaxID=1286189 RepID=A0A7W4K5X5_9PROT|nr:ferric reductase-like transmembrane domain-containing protein [Gluconacetobacter tumulisoli]MBB2200982.1 ferric reductase like transmembrane component [Gluconacetobacter tumulisoli]